MNKQTKTIPVMANRAPWNELVLRGKRQVKTLSFNWKYRGKILLYTSSNRTDDWGLYDYKLKMKMTDIPKGAIVGIVDIVDVIPTDEIPNEMFVRDPNLEFSTGQPFVAIINNVKRFKTPITFKPPKGAIRIFRAPVSFLKRTTV